MSPDFHESKTPENNRQAPTPIPSRTRIHGNCGEARSSEIMAPRQAPPGSCSRPSTERTAGEPEPYRRMSRRQLIDRIQSLTIESARHRRGKRYWKNYAQQLENKLDGV